MEDITEAIGQLSTNAKEWKPGKSYASPTPQVTGPGHASPYQQNYQSTSAPSGPISPNPTSPTPQFRPSAIRHSPVGRNAGSSGGAEWQLQPRGDDYVPGNQWRNNVQGLPQPRGGWDASPRSPHAAQEEQLSPHSQSGQKPYGDASTVPSGPHTQPQMRNLHSLGLTDELWRFHRDLALESRREMDPADPRHKAVPPSFSNVYALEDGNSGVRSSFGYPTSVFKVMSRDGHLYCLRRLDNVRSVSYKIASAVTERWATARSVNSGVSVVDHPGVVRFYRCFLSNRAVFFLHHYIPGARSLRERFMDRSKGGGVPLPEPLIWSCVTQLISAMRSIHSANLACRTIQLNHLLFTSSDGGWGEGGMIGHLRLRINCLGVVDALEFEARKGLAELQREDMCDLGRVILSLATGTEIHRGNSTVDAIRRCEVFVAQNYSRDLHSLAMSLVGAAHPPSVRDVSAMIAGRVFDELDASHSMYDRADAALAAEYESGRSLRLLLKLGFVNERPEFGVNRRWSESGDCYVLKLFRDYVFHQADGAGRPIMDLGHVVTAMNKLDAADEEKIVLSSRDGKSLLVVSFADVARCLDSAYNELCAGAVAANVDTRGGAGLGY